MTDLSEKPKENTIVKFTVTDVKDYGIMGLIDGKISGFVHVTELSWTEYLNPNDLFNIGDVIDAVVLEINEDRERISLGIKQLVENPWETFCKKYNKGDIVKGEVSQLNHPLGGVVVKFTEGVTGILLDSDMSYDEDYKHCFVKGQKIETILLSRDAGTQKIYLGIKQINPSKWNRFTENYRTGDVVNALIKRFHRGKIIADIDNGIEAFVEIQRGKSAVDASLKSLLKKSESGQQMNQFLDVGDKIQAKIMFINKRDRTVDIVYFLKDSI